MLNHGVLAFIISLLQLFAAGMYTLDGLPCSGEPWSLHEVTHSLELWFSDFLMETRTKKCILYLFSIYTSKANVSCNNSNSCYVWFIFSPILFHFVWSGLFSFHEPLMCYCHSWKAHIPWRRVMANGPLGTLRRGTWPCCGGRESQEGPLRGGDACGTSWQAWQGWQGMKWRQRFLAQGRGGEGRGKEERLKSTMSSFFLYCEWPSVFWAFIGFPLALQPSWPWF